MFNSFDDVVANGQFTENAINPADSYRQQSNLIPPVQPTAGIPQELPKQEPNDPGWGWTQQKAWNAKIEKKMDTGFDRLEKLIQQR